MTTGDRWDDAIQRMLRRMRDTADRVGNRFPHWANPDTGDWVTTPDGDWTGGFWIGMHWLAHRATSDAGYQTWAERRIDALRRRVEDETVFKAFVFYYGAALGFLLASHPAARDIGLACAKSLARLYDPALRLIPLGRQAEEGAHVGTTETSIDGLVAAPLLFWAAHESGDRSLQDVAQHHAERVLALHLRADGSFIQSTSLDPKTGAVLRHYTHKGHNDTSTWGRAQAWGMLFGVLSYLHGPREERWLAAATRGADWWMAHVPPDRVAYWDFDDPAIPGAERDTAATAIATSALLKLGAVAPASRRAEYRAWAEATADALVTRYLTPTHAADPRPPGILTEACFNKRADSRPQDAASSCEFIVGSYYLLESLLVLSGALGPIQI
jgi:unsaturated chondroitin disaccharide hydrolase